MSESNLNVSYKEAIEIKRSQELDILHEDNKKLKVELEERGFDLCNSHNDIVQLKQEILRLRLKIQSLESQLENNYIPEVDNTQWLSILAEERHKNSELNQCYQLLMVENKSLQKKINSYSNLVGENANLANTCEDLRREINEHLKTIFNLKVELRRTPPQESLEFQHELEKIKSVLIAHKEPSSEVKKELEDLKNEIANLRLTLSAKDQTLEHMDGLLKSKDTKLKDVLFELEEKNEALTRISGQIIECKVIEAELTNALRIAKQRTEDNKFDNRFIKNNAK